MKYYHQRQSGLTLTEIVVVVGLVSVLMLGIFSFARNTFRYQGEFQGRLAMLSDVRRVLGVMVAEIRQTQDSSVGGYALKTVATNSLTFFSDITGDGNREQVSYFLEDETLKKAVIEPSGDPLAYATNTQYIIELIDNVVDLEFKYYDESYSGAGGQGNLPDPFPAIDVRLIEIIVTVDDDVNREPNPLGVISAFAQLRNIKDNF